MIFTVTFVGGYWLARNQASWFIALFVKPWFPIMVSTTLKAIKDDMVDFKKGNESNEWRGKSLSIVLERDVKKD